MRKSPPPFVPQITRSAILNTLPRDTAVYGDAPELKYFYVPRRHAQALDFDSVLVRGIRGSGKSVWWAALQSEEHRQIILRALPRTDLDERTRVSPGFGGASRPGDYPDKRIIKSILSTHPDPDSIWRTIIAWHSWGKTGPLGALETWRERVAWIENHPEESARRFSDYDKKLHREGAKHLFLFDALDRAAEGWDHLLLLLRGLLETLLEFRSFVALRAKAFVRHDMLVSAITSFPDASKVTANAAELRWQTLDLYGLLWQHLGNAPGEAGKDFREYSAGLSDEAWKSREGVWAPPSALRNDEQIQRDVFHSITGPWMGRDHRRGLPYRWLPNHLADALGQVSPRSFLAAVRAAAEDERYGNHPYALHYEAIKRGVQAASTIRVQEVEEDFPWIGEAMEPLRGLVIPCPFEDIEERWMEKDALDAVRRSAGLPPRQIRQGLQGLRKDLMELGMLQEMPDGRINMPDVYRVGFGLGRMGGVKPVR